MSEKVDLFVVATASSETTNASAAYASWERLIHLRGTARQRAVDWRKEQTLGAPVTYPLGELKGTTLVIVQDLASGFIEEELAIVSAEAETDPTAFIDIILDERATMTEGTLELKKYPGEGGLYGVTMFTLPERTGERKLFLDGGPSHVWVIELEDFDVTVE